MKNLNVKFYKQLKEKNIKFFVSELNNYYNNKIFVTAKKSYEVI